MKPEVSANADNNCNGCIDEGSKLYCDRNKAIKTLAFLQVAANKPDVSMCCDASGGAAARAACLTAYKGSISAANPKGSQYFLPCWDAGTDTTNIPSKWLCADPGETCDELDNNCDVQVDKAQRISREYRRRAAEQVRIADAALSAARNVQRPGRQLRPRHRQQHCHDAPELDAVFGVPATCPFVAQETCNGCDDDCNGIIDDGVADQPCGFFRPRPRAPASRRTVRSSPACRQAAASPA